MLKTLNQLCVEIGDTVRYRGDLSGEFDYPGGPITITGLSPYKGDGIDVWHEDPWWEKVEPLIIKSTKPSGGPSSYYDFPFKDWTTVNDMIEYLSDKQWGKHSWIFKDILKACTRWGAKDGTTHSYDAKKIIYYGARLLMSVTDKSTLRKYLQELLDDKQFKE